MTSLDGSLLALGSCIAGIGFLMAGLLALLFRHPNPPRWARPEIAALLLCVPVAGAIGLGLGYMAYGFLRLVKGTGDPRGLLVLAAVVIALALLWRGLRFRQRLKDYAAAASRSELVQAQASLATDQEPRPGRPTQGPSTGLPGTPA